MAFGSAASLHYYHVREFDSVTATLLMVIMGLLFVHEDFETDCRHLDDLTRPDRDTVSWEAPTY